MEITETGLDEKNNENKHKILIPFLRKIANSLENGDLEPKQLGMVGEFFMKYQCEEELSNGKEQEFTDKDMKKFLFLGWYVYTKILEDNTMSEEEISEEDRRLQLPCEFEGC
jgi:hypothetical protein